MHIQRGHIQPGRIQSRYAWLAFVAAAIVCAAPARAALAAAEEKAAASAPNGTALLLEIRDAIGPATSRFFVRTLDRASERKARLIILEMDTPGGLDSAMRDMIQAILASPIPVAIYIAPSGSRAASAGTYLYMEIGRASCRERV